MPGGDTSHWLPHLLKHVVVETDRIMCIEYV
jgi:hypothetical protein